MTPAAQIATTIEMLSEILVSDRPADGVISAYFRSHRYMGSNDRSYVMERLYRIMRHYHRLSWHLKEISARNLVLADMCMIRHQDPKDFFGSDKYSPDELSDKELVTVSYLSKQRLHHRSMPEHIKLECPEWAVDSLKEYLGPKFKNVMESMLVEASLDFRVNTIKTDIDTLQKALKEEGIEAEKTANSPWGLRVSGKRIALGNLKAFKAGHFEVQDEGSQMVALVVDPKPSMRVFDFCAGAGGKSLALGMMMNNKGSIMATDISEGRLKRAKERFRRAGLHNVTTHKIEHETDKWLKRHHGKYDLVLVDAPCTGTGTWRRDPDKKWRDIGPKMEDLLELQAKILDSAAKLVKPEGRLIYSTCSLLIEENQKQFESFLERHEDMECVDLRNDDKLTDLKLRTPYLELNPAEHKTDGFFCAIAVRNKEKNKDNNNKDIKSEE